MDHGAGIPGLENRRLNGTAAERGEKTAEARMATQDILIHDFAGHPFQVDLSRELARRGWRVTHAFCQSDHGPKGDMRRRVDDSEHLRFVAFGKTGRHNMQNLGRRWLSDLAYGSELAGWIERNRPRIIVSGNTPIEAQAKAQAAAHRVGARFVFWCQDLHGLAAKSLIGQAGLGLGALAARHIERLEIRLLKASDSAIFVSDEFRAYAHSSGVSPDRSFVIRNWASLTDILPVPRNNNWAKEMNLPSGPRAAYTGTIGRKHDAGIISCAARVLGPSAVTVITNQDAGAVIRASCPGVRVLPFQPMSRMADVLGAADILIAQLRNEAGAFCVPSKILSYLCAGRPVLMAAPRNNPAARIVREADAGLVVLPEDTTGFERAILSLAKDPARCREMGRNARAYAERAFRIGPIADDFQQAMGLRPESVAA